MAVPLLDLKAQYATIKDEILSAVTGVLDSQRCIGGPKVSELEEKIAAPLGLDIFEAAAGMYRVINVNMATGVREVSVKRGHDPREFPLVVAGGAGPVHACQIARELEIPVMVVPKESSIFCAAGMLMSDLKHNFVKTYTTLLTKIDKTKFTSLFREMEEDASRLLKSELIPEDSINHEFSLDMRYVKQYHEVNVKITREEIKGENIELAAGKFHPEHNRLYGYSLEKEGTPVELINLRLLSVGKTAKPKFKQEEYDGEDPVKAYKRKRKIYLPVEKEFKEVPVYDGHRLRYGNKVEGPAVIELVNTTTLVFSEFCVLCDKYGSYTMYVREKEDHIQKKLGIGG